MQLGGLPGVPRLETDLGATRIPRTRAEDVLAPDTELPHLFLWFAGNPRGGLALQRKPETGDRHATRLRSRPGRRQAFLPVALCRDWQFFDAPGSKLPDVPISIVVSAPVWRLVCYSSRG